MNEIQCHTRDTSFYEGKEIKEACIKDYLVIFDTGFLIQ